MKTKEELRIAKRKGLFNLIIVENIVGRGK